MSDAVAGITGENIMVVVNADSLDSRTVANHYVALRKIPPNNVIFLSDIPGTLSIGLEDFKTVILKPVLQTIEKRGLVAQTRCIAYSADFPTSVDIREHFQRLPNAQAKKLIGRLASITGATYFYKYLLADSESYLSFASNIYARGPFERSFNNPFKTEHKETFDTAKAGIDGDQPADAAKQFEQLFVQHPTLAPLAVLSARGYAAAGQTEPATRMIKAAIKAGWWSAEFFREDPALNPLLSDADLKRVLPALSDHPTHVQGPMAFSAIKGWTDCGYPVPIKQGGMPFMLSCSLAIVHPRGNTLSQAVTILQRAVAADRTFPDGQFRFGTGTDVRATTRFPGVGDALLYLQLAGFDSDVYRSSFPTKPGDVAGLFVGAATVNFKNTKWKLQPGAIAESLTSLGGDFRNSSQTKLTEYLAGGAAISSGSVTEPYSLQPKFPRAMMHGYYASGLTAIESYYLSVESPYQLLIAGDPACQPFANPPAETVQITLDESDGTKVRFTRQPSAEPKTGAPYQPASPHRKPSPVASYEIYIEGRLVKAVPAVKSVDMNINGGLSGVVDVRSVLVGFADSEPKLTFYKQIELAGPLPTPQAVVLVGRKELDRSDKSPADDGSKSKTLTVQLDCAGADKIEVMHQSAIVASLDGASGAVEIDLSKLGGGPLHLRPVATVGEKKVMGFTISNDTNQ
ncbi:hypothetical protein [Stieleria marina]